jgi:hypothetical protein
VLSLFGDAFTSGEVVLRVRSVGTSRWPFLFGGISGSCRAFSSGDEAPCAYQRLMVRRAPQVSWLRSATRPRLRRQGLLPAPARASLPGTSGRVTGVGEHHAAQYVRRQGARIVSADNCRGAMWSCLAGWFAHLPADTPLERLVHLAKLRWRIEVTI